MHDDTLSHHEFDTEPFTASELTAIMGYRKAIEGIPDAIMETTAAEMGAAATAFGPAAAKSLLTDHGDALNTWFLALDQALAELLTCTTESTRYSTAAGRFLTAEAAAYHRARQHFEHTTTVFLLGRDTTPLIGNYPRFTSSLNLPMQCLEDE
ncbi:hypothetical protein C6N75_00620 [Streptomyces solincola]|uniref:Uncharacterized protein n=1 Tax=Streptomyces solincola TaxID=2100817 RepID=A0A2S9Q360_9ACTN|nr:hypothetical protein [Streptomyces solincola]PRH81082.1 hypothetical protein C6N75_00620 [Streptomyces solincola]